MEKKREEQNEIKRLYVDSGMHDALMKRVKEKAEPSIKAEDLPF